MDLTAKLPDDVLCEVFGHISSLPDKFKLSAVNHKLRRCMNTVFRKPQPLFLEFNSGHDRLNGHTIDRTKWPQVVHVLAAKTQFNRIEIHQLGSHDYITLLDHILTILCNTACLNRLTHFVSRALCTPSVLHRFVENCPELSSVDLDINLLAPDIDIDETSPFISINLADVLNNKALRELILVISGYKQHQLLGLFNAIWPNVTNKLDLTFRNAKLDMVSLVHELAGGPWAALRQIRFKSCGIKNQFTHLDEVFALLSDTLPQLNQCCFDFVTSPVPVEVSQMVGIAVALLNQSDRENPLEVDYLNKALTIPGCQVINFVQQLRNVLPGLQVKFDVDQESDRMEINMKLVLGNITFVTRVSGTDPCDHPGCVHCLSYYPCVLYAVVRRAGQQENTTHLQGYVIDRCRISSLLVHINRWAHLGEGMHWKALTVVLNEQQDKVVVAFETREGHQYQITVDCGRCFSVCIACMEV